MILDFFKKTKECQHHRITADKDAGYCPDCGKYIENEWYITRCGCCGVKQKTIVTNGQIASDAKFCHNCGNNSFVVEKLSKINFIDIKFAVVIKKEVEDYLGNLTQSWVEPEVEFNPKCIGCK